MAEVNWGTEDNQPKKKKRIPTWAWIGGGCCGVVVLGIIAMVVVGIVAGRTLNDQPKNWGKVGEYVQIDESFKQNSQITKLPFQMGHEGAWQIAYGEEAIVYIRVFDGENASAMRKRLFVDQDKSAYQQIGVLRAKQIESGTIEVQGRSVARVRFLSRDKSDETEEAESQGEPSGERSAMDIAMGAINPGVSLVDISPEGSAQFVLFHYSVFGATDQVSDESVVRVLEPFHVGPNR